MIKSGADAAADFQHPLKRDQGERAKMRQSVLKRVDKTGRTVRYFQELEFIYELNSCISSYLEKH